MNQGVAKVRTDKKARERHGKRETAQEHGRKTHVGGGLLVVELDRAAEVEPLLDLLGICVGEVAVENGGDRLADELADDVVGAAHFAFVLELDFAGDAGKRGENVADARDNEALSVN